MKHVLTIAAFVFCTLNTALAQQSGTYVTYIAGKPEFVDEWTITTEQGTIKTTSALGKAGAAPSQRAVTIAVTHRPKSFVLLQKASCASVLLLRAIPNSITSSSKARVPQTLLTTLSRAIFRSTWSTTSLPGSKNSYEGAAGGVYFRRRE